MNRARSLLLVLFIAAAAAGCKSQVTPSPVPAAIITWPAVTCPAGQTCGAFSYIVSRATCASASACPTVDSGNYTPLNQSTPAASASYNDTPPEGVYVAYVIQAVEAGAPPLTGLPSAASTATLIASYPGTPAAPIVTQTAALAPPLLPDAPEPQLTASNVVPVVARPRVAISLMPVERNRP